MKFREVGTIILVVFVSVCGLYTLAHKLKPNFVKPDNFVEEYIEDIIENKTGIELDLTPAPETGGFVQDVDWDKIREIFDRYRDDED